MLKIYVCEDNLPERQRIIDIITKVICIEEYDMELALASDDPHKLLEFLRQTPSTAVYFLDIWMLSHSPPRYASLIRAVLLYL